MSLQAVEALANQHGMTVASPRPSTRQPTKGPSLTILNPPSTARRPHKPSPICAISRHVDVMSKSTPFLAPPLFQPGDDTERSVVQWILERTPTSSSKTYAPYAHQFERWCEEHKLTHFPAKPATISKFLIHLNDDRHLAVNTIRVAASAVSSQYKFSHLTSPVLDPLVKATQRVIAMTGKPARQMLPMTVEMVSAIARRHASDSSFVGVRNTFMILLMMASFCRESEIVALEREDVWLDTAHTHTDPHTPALFIFIQKAKCDQERKGYTVLVPAGSSPLLCPHEWFKRYLRVRSKQATLLFHQDNNNDGLSPQTPYHVIKNELTLVGVDAKGYGSHSCRSGGVSEALDKGDVALHLLKRHGRWKSDAILNYVRDSWERQMKVKVF